MNEILKAGKTIRVSNRNAGKAHHATVKALVNMGCVVVRADKTLALTPSEEHHNPARSKAESKLREALAFAMEREATCRRMMDNGTCNRARWMQWVRKVEALRNELNTL
jgi:hypothetical protein